MELIADEGSGVPACRPPLIVKERAEYVEEEAEPGTLVPWKLSPLGRLALSLPCTAAMLRGCIEGRKTPAS